MAESGFDKLITVDEMTLRDVVAQDQNSPSFEIAEWSVRRLSAKGIMNPDGLWLISGVGSDGNENRPWSVVLKILKRQDEEPPLDNMWHWKRELLFAQSELVETLNGPVIAPRFYKVEETPEGARLWLELVENQRPEPWSVADYAFAAHELGAWNGRWADGRPIPLEPWMARQHYRSWYTETNPEVDFQFHLNQKHIQGGLRRRYEKLWEERGVIYDVLERLPLTLSHFDSQRRNLMIRRGVHGRDELVLLDWAQCGLGPVGSELNYLVVMSTGLMDWPASRLNELDRAAFDGYMNGLAEAGWQGGADIVRLGYVAMVCAWVGLVHPNVVAGWCSESFRTFAVQFVGLAGEELFLSWLPAFEYSLDCADEARALIKRLGCG